LPATEKSNGTGAIIKLASRLSSLVKKIAPVPFSVPVDPSKLDLSTVHIATIKLGKDSRMGFKGGDFKSCTNCGGIIPPKVNVYAGRRAQ
jgi:hypothetical protein